MTLGFTRRSYFGIGQCRTVQQIEVERANIKNVYELVCDNFRHFRGGGLWLQSIAAHDHTEWSWSHDKGAGIGFGSPIETGTALQ